MSIRKGSTVVEIDPQHRGLIGKVVSINKKEKIARVRWQGNTISNTALSALQKVG